MQDTPLEKRRSVIGSAGARLPTPRRAPSLHVLLPTAPLLISYFCIKSITTARLENN